MGTVALVMVICLLIGYILIREYNPKIDIVFCGRKKSVLLWYNKDNRRAYKHLFNLKL